MTEPADALPFTGERFTPECVREIWYEHWHRYAFAMAVCQGKNVLDAACGEGYGSNLVAGVAREVIGLDISAEAIAHARQRYAGEARVRFEVGDAAALAFPDRRFDVVLSFETLEHLAAQQELVAGFARVLAEDGVLLISSPDKRTYSEIAGFRNEFHVRELYREELLELLGAHFPHVRLYGQKLLFQSCLWSLDGDGVGSTVATAAADGSIVEGSPDQAPLYYVAACSRQPLPPTLPARSWFGDREESVYSHYNGEVRKNMRAGARIAELEAELERLRQSTPNRAPSRWLRWLRR
jgi:SAM-dependent methyltransferase